MVWNYDVLFMFCLLMLIISVHISSPTLTSALYKYKLVSFSVVFLQVISSLSVDYTLIALVGNK